MHLGLRPRVPFPASYRGYHLLRTHGRVYYAPLSLCPEPEDLLHQDLLMKHGAVGSAATLQEVQAQIDQLLADGPQPRLIGATAGHDLYEYHGQVHGVPREAAPVDLDLVEDRRRANVLTASSAEELRTRIRDEQDSTPVEFAGWLPIFEFSGNCGKHPQFTHTGEPPPGYRFRCSAPRKRRPWRWLRKLGQKLATVGESLLKIRLFFNPAYAIVRPDRRVSLTNRLRVLAALARLFFRLLRQGCGLGATLRFLQSRHFQSQLLVARHRGLVFLTSMPYTYGQDPWVIEIEDPTTLFYPLLHNGQTSDLVIRNFPYYRIVKSLLESEHCRGIITHMRSTAQLVPTLFDSEVIRNKITYAPLGVRLPTRWQRHDSRADDGTINLLFINSWCQVPSNFYVRGGLDVLEAFAILHERYPQLRLTLRTNLPPLDPHYHRILQSGWVRIIDRFLTNEEMADLHTQSQVFLLPAARVHIVSLLQAMSYGLAVVASDGWGVEEYVEHERNGLIVRGRYGKVSWADQEAGILREDYTPMYTPDPEVVQGIVEAVSRLVEEPELRAQLGRNARSDVESRYSLREWNLALKTAFDRALGVEGMSQPVWTEPTLATAGACEVG